MDHNRSMSQHHSVPHRKPDLMTGSEALLHALLEEGVETVFGYPGGSALYIYDAMVGNSDFKHILTRHEQGAIHAADGYARSTGRVGVCIATSGPGATNLITGIATAYMDSIPLVVITANVPTTLIGTDAFQEADIISMTMPITKHSYSVRDAADIPRIVHEAFHLAGTGRKGPVLIDIPKDVSNASMRYESAQELNIRGYTASPTVDESKADQLLQAIAESEKPLIIAGAGVVHSDASAELIQFVNAVHIPVASTLLGLSGFPSAHPYSLGMAGHHGNYAANMAIQNADLIISIGSRFDDRLTMRVSGFAPNARRIAHLDIDPAEIGKNVKTDIGIVGDIQQILAYANAKLAAAAPMPAESRSGWLRQIERDKAEHPLRYDDSDTAIKPQYVLEMIHKETKGEAIVTTDVGQHQMWVAQFYKFTYPRSLLSSGGLGTMGFGFPAAIGAQIGNPDRLVISVNGDGGMQMCAQELAICALHQIPVKIVVLNNRVLGMVRQQQEIMYEKHFSQIDLAGSPDFVKLAEAYGIKGLRASSKADAVRVWREAVQTAGPVLVEFEIPTDENVYPMVLAGSALDEMILGGFD